MSAIYIAAIVIFWINQSVLTVEADMHNEPIDAHELNRSSYGNKLTGYLSIFKDDIYRSHYGIPNMQVFNVNHE